MAHGSQALGHCSRVCDVGHEPLKILSPIPKCDDLPSVSLEEAIKPLKAILPNIEAYARIAKEETPLKPADGLTRNESGAIRLYTTEGKSRKTNLYYKLNETLRSEDRSQLEPWLRYLKLFLSGLNRLPSARQFVYRGVKSNFRKSYKKGQVITWWSFSSCSLSIEALENNEFFGMTGERTVFTIDCYSGKDISKHSCFQSEKEILLPPASQFDVVGCMELAPGVNMIQLRETESSTKLFKADSLYLSSKSISASGKKKHSFHTFFYR